MAKTQLSYCLPDPYKSLNEKSLEGVVRLTRNVKKGKRLVEAECDDAELSVKLQGDDWYTACYFVDIQGQQKEDLYNAVIHFVEGCGAPDFVKGNCYTVNKALQEYEKRLKNKLFGTIFRKRVVNLK